tara:strand:- start:181 stop:582 length:402 start_codon:yes stop_codon:yes gene_type:complete
MNKITMDQIHKAWNDAVDALVKHNHKTRPPSMEWLFMVELKKLDIDIGDIITYIYCNHGEVEKENEELNAEIELLKEVNESTRVNLVKELANMKDLQSNIEDLESSLVTARYFIFLGSMFAFLLGLACLFLVV